MEQAQRKRASRPAEQEEAQAPADLRDEQLSEDVSCCLAEVDSVLAEVQDERDKAVEEFAAIRNQYKSGAGTEDEQRLWMAKYQHLGLEIGWCCGVPRLRDENGWV